MEREVTHNPKNLGEDLISSKIAPWQLSVTHEWIMLEASSNPCAEIPASPADGIRIAQDGFPSKKTGSSPWLSLVVSLLTIIVLCWNHHYHHCHPCSYYHYHDPFHPAQLFTKNMPMILMSACLCLYSIGNVHTSLCLLGLQMAKMCRRAHLTHSVDPEKLGCVADIGYIHTFSPYVCVYGPIYESIYLSICLSACCLSIYMFLYLSLYLPNYRSIYPSIYLSMYLSIYPSI